ncbi:MAG: hypothetical protein DMF65_09855, partial [Acidobacteria bacterium]
FGLGPFPELGVTGAAIATSIGRGTGALFAFSRLLRAGGRVQLTRRHARIEPAIMMRLVRLSGAGTFQVFIAMASWVGLTRINAGFGSEAIAGNTIGLRVIMFALLPSWGMSNAAATLVGQSLGAGKPERAERAVWRAGFYNMCFLGGVGLVFILFAGPIVRVFTQGGAGPAVEHYAVACLRTIACGFLFYAYGMVLTQSFNGAGDTRTPTIINLFVFWLWEIPLAYTLAFVFKMGPQGVFLAVTAQSLASGRKECRSFVRQARGAEDSGGDEGGRVRPSRRQGPPRQPRRVLRHAGRAARELRCPEERGRAARRGGPFEGDKRTEGETRRLPRPRGARRADPKHRRPDAQVQPARRAPTEQTAFGLINFHVSPNAVRHWRRSARLS